MHFRRFQQRFAPRRRCIKCLVLRSRQSVRELERNPVQVSLGNPYSLSGSPRFGHDISHGDFDGDGILDLVVVSSDNHGDYVYFGTGDGTFTSPLFVSQGSRGAVAVCDVNGDGHMDIIIGDYYSTRSLQVYVNNGSGSRTSLFSSVQIQGT